MAKCAPLLISVYNRFEHLKRCIEALKRNRLAPETDLYVVSDAAYREEDRQVIAEIRNYLKELVGFKTIICLFWDVNKGSHASTMDAIKVLFEKYDCFIRVEDDIIVSTDFLDYMNAGLSYYKDDPNVYAICGYKAPFCIPKNYEFDVWFYPAFSPWGYPVWKHKFNEIDRSDWDRYSELKKDKSKYKAFKKIGFYIVGILKDDSAGKIVAGDLRVYYHMFQNNMYSVFPVVSKTQNWGFDGTGEHCGNKQAWWAKPDLDTRDQPTRFISFNGYNEDILQSYRKFQDKINGGLLAKWLKYTWVHRLWKKVRRKV